MNIFSDSLKISNKNLETCCIFMCYKETFSNSIKYTINQNHYINQYFCESYYVNNTERVLSVKFYTGCRDFLS